MGGLPPPSLEEFHTHQTHPGVGSSKILSWLPDLLLGSVGENCGKIVVLNKALNCTQFLGPVVPLRKTAAFAPLQKIWVADSNN